MLHHPHPHPHMHELSQQYHAFTPILQPWAAAATRAQDRNVNSTLHGTEVSFGTAFHRATQKSSSTEVRGRWGALHVSIAWKIYYHKQLKRAQENPGSPTCEAPISSGQKEEPPSYMNPYLQSQCGRWLYDDVGKAPPSVSRHRRYPPPPHAPSARSENNKDSPTADVCRHPRLNPEPDSGRRKRPLACEGFEKAKRAKQEVADFHSHPSHFVAARSYLSSHDLQAQHVRDIPAAYPGGYDASYPGEPRHYQTAPWEPLWDTKRLQLHAGLNPDAAARSCKATRTHFVNGRQRKEAFFTSPVCFPAALRSLSPLQGSASSCWPSGNVQVMISKRLLEPEEPPDERPALYPNLNPTENILDQPSLHVEAPNSEPRTSLTCGLFKKNLVPQETISPLVNSRK